MMEDIKAHDLLKIHPAGVLALSAAGGFFSVPLKDFPFVVVRRAEQKDGLIPVGIRGRERHERSAAWLNPLHVAARVPPESIALHTPLPPLPAFESITKLELLWRKMKMTWGVTGSVGFELASGCKVVHERSDLDLVIRAATPLALDFLRGLMKIEQDLPCKIDVQVETPYGAFAAKEYLRTPAQCLLRTIYGPRLVIDPWVPPLSSEQHQ
jgi:phosphoribosyl-dephospho-CoA transferase